MDWMKENGQVDQRTVIPINTWRDAPREPLKNTALGIAIPRHLGKFLLLRGRPSLSTEQR